MIFTKYPIENIEKFWDGIAKSIKENLPPTVYGLKVSTDYILTKLLTDEMQMWVFMDDEREGVHGFIITAFSEELAFKIRQLIVYAAVSVIHIPNEEWSKAFGIVKDFAYKYECSKILAYTNNPRVIEIVNTLGGSAEYHLAVLEV